MRNEGRWRAGEGKEGVFDGRGVWIWLGRRGKGGMRKRRRGEGRKGKGREEKKRKEKKRKEKKRNEKKRNEKKRKEVLLREKRDRI